MTREEFLYRMAKTVSYPTWVAAFTIGILRVRGVIKGREWDTAALVLLGIAMPIGVKLSRMELSKTMIAVYETGMENERQYYEEMYRRDDEEG